MIRPATVRDCHVWNVRPQLDSCSHAMKRPSRGIAHISYGMQIWLIALHACAQEMREALGIRLEGAVVIMDEAHNLVDAVNACHRCLRPCFCMRGLSHTLNAGPVILLGKPVQVQWSCSVVVRCMHQP